MNTCGVELRQQDSEASSSQTPRDPHTVQVSDSLVHLISEAGALSEKRLSMTVPDGTKRTGGLGEEMSGALSERVWLVWSSRGRGEW